MNLRGRHLLALGWRAILLVVLVGSVPFFTVAVLEQHGGRILFDFRGGLYDAGRAILHGHDPYHAAFLAHQLAVMRSGLVAIGETSQYSFSIPLYPAPTNLAVLPLSLLPFWVAGLLYTLVSIAAVVAGLRLLGVRDWRCHALAMLSWPFLYGLYLGALGPFLLLGAGIAWRWRDRLWPPAMALAAIIVAKIFPWPFAIWLLITRRFKALALVVVLGLGVTLAAWALIGFAGLAQYPQMLSDASMIQAGRATSIVAVLLWLGIPFAVASLLALGVAGLVLVAAWGVARREGGERGAFALVAIAALCGTPIVWDHYMVLLFIPIALMTPAASWLWLIPLTTPPILATAAGLLPMGNKPTPHAPDSLRSAALWLTIQAFLTLRICLAGGVWRSVAARLRPTANAPSARPIAEPALPEPADAAIVS